MTHGRCDVQKQIIIKLHFVDKVQSIAVSASDSDGRNRFRGCLGRFGNLCTKRRECVYLPTEQGWLDQDAVVTVVQLRTILSNLVMNFNLTYGLVVAVGYPLFFRIIIVRFMSSRSRTLFIRVEQDLQWKFTRGDMSDAKIEIFQRLGITFEKKSHQFRRLYNTDEITVFRPP